MTEHTKRITIDSINLNLGGRKIELTIDECKKLHEKLAEMFGNITHNHYSNNGITYPYSPTSPSPWITWENQPGGPLPTITCDTSQMPSGTSVSNTTLCIDAA